MRDLIIQAEKNINDFIEMSYITAKTKFNNEVDGIDKNVTTPMIEEYLKKRGYVSNNILGRKVMVNSFTCVCVDKDYIQLWHDCNGIGSQFISKDYLTALPIALNYMERMIR